MIKINIAICDDNELVLDELHTIGKRWAKSSNKKCEFILFTAPQELLASQIKFDALFLDIEMPGKDGFKVARMFRNSYQDLPIIFITSHCEMIQEAFKVHAFRYIYKPINEAEIMECLGDLLIELSSKQGFLFKDRLILNRDILYIESLGDGSVIHLTGEDIINKQSLKYWNEFLCDQFCKCHKSYIVNLQRIKQLTDKNVILADDETVPISVRKKSTVKNCYFDYVVKNAKCL